jgi:AcrR family transcriptional regulator
MGYHPTLLTEGSLVAGTVKRADARRSYESIVTAAGAVIARDGSTASLEEIARTAGVGSATLHRHFGSRWALLDAVFTDRVDELCAEAQRSAAAKPPLAALVDWLHTVAIESARNRGLAASMFAERPTDAIADDSCHDKIRDAGQRLLANAIADGAVRPDVSIAELLTLISAIVIATETSGAAASEIESLLTLVLEGVYPRSD